MTGGPTARSERITAIDVLRGFALLGILGANVPLFGLADSSAIDAAFDDLEVGWTGAPFRAWLLVVVLNKMMAVFSMLFGAGVLLVVDNVERRGGSALGLHYRRNLLLLAIGLAHGALWFGDILTVYGACALVLYPLRRLPVPALFGGAGAIWALAFVVGTGSDEQYVVRALAMMLAGMALYRTGVITGARPTDWYRRWAVRTLSVGLSVVAVGWSFDEDVAVHVNNIAVPAVAFGYVCLVMAVCGAGRLPRVRGRLAAAGQMALTNYLMQSVLGLAALAVLDDWRGERVDALWMMVVMLAIWVVQLAWSDAWLRRFRFGPVEWLWRSATYRRFQPLRA